MSIFQYAVAWLLFAVMHSLLAKPSIQILLEKYLGRGYRLFYNLQSLLSVAVVLYFGKQWVNDNRFLIFDNTFFITTFYIAQFVGMALLVVAFAFYDMGRFSGITQLFTGERISLSSNEPLQRRGLNKWVRHPLYTGAFFVLWGGAFSYLGIWTAIWATLYLVIGTRFEERKLLRIYGEEYRLYQQQVPRYFPQYK